MESGFILLFLLFKVGKFMDVTMNFFNDFYSRSVSTETSMIFFVFGLWVEIHHLPSSIGTQNSYSGRCLTHSLSITISAL